MVSNTPSRDSLTADPRGCIADLRRHFLDEDFTAMRMEGVKYTKQGILSFRI
jgi:hypothetical protein